jgi:subtilase family serine protease
VPGLPPFGPRALEAWWAKGTLLALRGGTGPATPLTAPVGATAPQGIGRQSVLVVARGTLWTVSTGGAKPEAVAGPLSTPGLDSYYGQVDWVHLYAWHGEHP